MQDLIGWLPLYAVMMIVALNFLDWLERETGKEIDTATKTLYIITWPVLLLMIILFYLAGLVTYLIDKVRFFKKD